VHGHCGSWAGATVAPEGKDNVKGQACLVCKRNSLLLEGQVDKTSTRSLGRGIIKKESASLVGGQLLVLDDCLRVRNQRLRAGEYVPQSGNALSVECGDSPVVGCKRDLTDPWRSFEPVAHVEDDELFSGRTIPKPNCRIAGRGTDPGTVGVERRLPHSFFVACQDRGPCAEFCIGQTRSRVHRAGDYATAVGAEGQAEHPRRVNGPWVHWFAAGDVPQLHRSIVESGSHESAMGGGLNWAALTRSLGPSSMAAWFLSARSSSRTGSFSEKMMILVPSGEKRADLPRRVNPLTVRIGLRLEASHWRIVVVVSAFQMADRMRVPSLENLVVSLNCRDELG